MKTPGKRTNKTQTDDTKNSKKKREREKKKKNMTKKLAGLSQTKPHAHILLEHFVFWQVTKESKWILHNVDLQFVNGC